MKGRVANKAEVFIHLAYLPTHVDLLPPAHYCSLMPQHVSSDAAKTFGDPDLSEGAGVFDSRGAACLHPSGTGYGIGSQFASCNLTPRNLE